ncbi:unnamed protein product [Schistosoma curassoni]|uniref:Transposase n=1 Tax=Schistosoma curassoni TaxID=6186 RepID=A0A183KHH4_9TREM|nr:unnamed protein product [Schistosoma curassoni]
MSVDRIPSATAYCVREQTSFQAKKKLGKDVGSGYDIHYGNHQTVSRGKPQLGMVKRNRKKKVEEHTTSGIGSKHKKNFPGQGWMENADGWHMLLHER